VPGWLKPARLVETRFQPAGFEFLAEVDGGAGVVVSKLLSQAKQRLAKQRLFASFFIY